MKRVKRILLTFLLSLFFYSIESLAVGNGAVDMSGVYLDQLLSSTPTYDLWRIKGTLDYVGFTGGAEDEWQPSGQTYLRLAIFPEGMQPNSANCMGAVNNSLCNFHFNTDRVQLVQVYDAINRIVAKTIPEPYFFAIYVPKNTKAVRLCGQWILSNGGTSETLIGQMTCGVRPPNILCNLSPQQITIDLGILQASKYTEGKSEVAVNCTGGSSDVKLFTLGSGDGSDVNLTGGEGNLNANITLNGQAAGGGLTFNVPAEGSVTVNIEAKVQTKSDSSGTYQGSVPLIMSYQ